MPFVTINWIEGRSLEQKREIAKRVTEVISEVGKVDPDAVRIFFAEHSKDQYAIAGKLLIDK
ncbi:MAG: 4-oxalocrotonate tautomerase [Desulfarculus sp.]|jgi:4-oxalocrotonate tautomerase|nr:MAG: 4-oxalocrotonate tautomerase [Desulfarculus sp.]